MRYPYHCRFLLSIVQFIVKQLMLESRNELSSQPGVENSIETDIIENANFAFEGYFGNKTLGLAGSRTW